MTNKYSHAYSYGFEVISNDVEAEDVNGAHLRIALIAKIHNSTDEEILECCDCAWDTFEIDDDD